jgi:glycosyltransferase involved in cell wall biosynthesis
MSSNHGRKASANIFLQLHESSDGTNHRAPVDTMNNIPTVRAQDVGLAEPRPNPYAGGYALMTAAYNEEATIQKTIESVLSQTLRPKRWVIVSDGSTDGTDAIVQRYANEYDFIRFLRMDRGPGRSFSSKVIALQAGSSLMSDVASEFIGNLDADISIDPAYFEDLIGRFRENSKLGLAGGFVCEEVQGQFESRPGNRVYSVAHAAQLVRRECYEAIGGYAVLEYGGEDWHAQTTARMKGWEAEAFTDLKIFHHRRTGEGDNLVRHKFRQGRMDYSFGSGALFETFKCLERLSERPLIIGGIARLMGFGCSWICRDKRPVSEEFVAFLRNEQKQKLWSLLTGVGRHARLKCLP